MNGSGKKVISFSFTDGAYYEEENTIGNVLWLKLYRDNHLLTGYFSADGEDWIQVGEAINVSSMDRNQPNYNGWIGTQQGLYVKGSSADFDLYIYRDAYSPIMAQPAANQYGTLRVVNGSAPAYLDSIDNNDWAMYAGVEFGGRDYYKKPVSLEISAASATSGGVVEVWLDSIDTGEKIAECTIENTGGWNNFQSFTADIDSVAGNHDVYLKFLGTGNLFRIDWFKFIGESYTPTSVDNKQDGKGGIRTFELNQNYPNPFNPTTIIKYSLPKEVDVTLKLINMRGQEVKTLVNKKQLAGNYAVHWDGRDNNGTTVSSGIYFYRIRAGKITRTIKMLLVK
jgi:xylan 1,4-beta-xylosidase